MSVVENLVKDYGDFLLDIPRWEIADEGVTALWGPSGSGKTSVFRCLIGIEPCSNLRWNFKGVDLAQLDPSERRLGVVFQSLELFPHMTAEENITFAARARGITVGEISGKVRALLEDLGILAIRSRRASLLSGGEAQRVALARALIGNPRVLLLDESFSSLDSANRGEARALVRRVVDRLRVPTILVTHDEADLKAVADRVIEIRDGRLVK